MYTDYKQYNEYLGELNELLSERNKVMALTEEQALERNGEPKAVTLYYLSADIDMYQKLVDDYVEVDEDDAHDTYLQQHALCYSQGLAY
jgi:hypothetical protein